MPANHNLMSELYYTHYESPVGLLQIGGTDNYITELTFLLVQ
jgi:methylated-DNA-[protein]-cysteine S-methyltransferase